MELYNIQVNNLEQSKFLYHELTKFKTAHGTYPFYLNDLPVDRGQRARGAVPVDYWGHPLYFEARNDSFILISFGRDGKPDGLDYWSLREKGEDVSICHDWDADQVMSDRWFHRECGK